MESKIKLSFTKMQGAGNDFVVFHDFPSNSSFSFSGKLTFPHTHEDNHTQDQKPLFASNTINSVQLEKICRFVADRKKGIGCDQVILVLPSSAKEAKYEMLVFNSDGSQAQMCGNGIRCFSKYILDNHLHGYSSDILHLSVSTLAGIIHCYPDLTHSLNNLHTLMVKVNMGPPFVMKLNEDKKSEFDPTQEMKSSLSPSFWLREVTVLDKTFQITVVSMGNPHAVIFVDSLSDIKVPLYGGKLETHVLFPLKANIEFVEVVDKQTIRVNVWERGTGETLACGTGACASVVASILNKKIDNENPKPVKVEMLGGVLEIYWDETNNRIYKTGPATDIFKGEIIIPNSIFSEKK